MNEVGGVNKMSVMSGLSKLNAVIEVSATSK